MSIAPRPGTVLPPARIATAVRDLIVRDGALAASARLGISRTSAMAIAAFCPARRGTVIAAAHALGIEVDES